MFYVKVGIYKVCFGDYHKAFAYYLRHLPEGATVPKSL